MQEKNGLWLIDVQEKLFPLTDRHERVLNNLLLMLKGGEILKWSLFVTEQYSEGLGTTVDTLKKSFPEGQQIFHKTAFSGYRDPEIKRKAEQLGIKKWILMGIETHICVLQTAKDLLMAKQQVTILADAVTSRSPFAHACALQELSALGARVTTCEAILYEAIEDAKSPQFKALLPFVKAHALSS